MVSGYTHEIGHAYVRAMVSSHSEGRTIWLSLHYLGLVFRNLYLFQMSEPLLAGLLLRLPAGSQVIGKRPLLGLTTRYAEPL